MAVNRVVPDKPKSRKLNVIKEKNIRYDPSKDYTGKRNILGQQKSRVSTETETVNKKGKPGVTKTLTTTKTRSISPNRTAVVGPGRVVKSKNRGSEHSYLKPKAKVRTVKNKNLDKFLEKHPGYKTTDGTLKTKTRTEKLNWDKGKSIKKNIPPSTGYMVSEWRDTTTDRQRELGITSKSASGYGFQSQDQYDYPKPKVTRDRTVKRGDLANSRIRKVKNVVGLRPNKVRK
jgi:hypothetical protein